jgi:DNA-binding NtrC family response regulator
MFFSGGEVSPLHLISNMLPKIKVMLVMAQERRLPLLDVLESCGIEVVPACNCNEARRMLETQSVQTVVTDRALPDGDWRAVLEIVAQDRANVQVVVCSRLGDHTLLIDVLEQGAYDVLVEPYQREEVRRVLEAAAARSDVRYRPLARMTGYKTKVARAAV